MSACVTWGIGRGVPGGTTAVGPTIDVTPTCNALGSVTP